jgi:hypothetical protein
VEGIRLQNNKLSGLHPKAFSNLPKKGYLYLTDNICINKQFTPVTSWTAVENELRACGVGDALQRSINRHETRFGSIENTLQKIDKKFDRKLESLTELFEKREKKVDGKLELITQLFGYLNERYEENAKDIKDINKKIEKIWDLLNSK